jgi:hypothetical protein
MGKTEDMRAMKDQRRAAAAVARPAPAAARPRSAPTAAPTPAAAPAAAPTPAGDALCGHRSIGNKSCTRPAGHAEKNHRYAAER